MLIFFAASGDASPPSMIATRDQMASVLAYGMPWATLAPFDAGTLSSEVSLRLLGHTFANAWAVPETSALTGSTSSEPVLTATILNYPMSNALVVGATNEISVKGLKRRNLDGTKVYLDDADVELTALLDSDGNPVPGTENIAMPYISGVGRSLIYGSVIPHTVPLVVGATYTEHFTAIDTDGNVRPLNKDITAIRG